MRISSKNIVQGISTVSTGGAVGTVRSVPTTATGFRFQDLFDGTLGRAWRGLSASSFQFVFNPVSAPDLLHPMIYAISDLRVISGSGAPVALLVETSTSPTTGFVSEGSASFVNNGNGSYSAINIPASGGTANSGRVYRRLTLSFSTIAVIQIGEIWIGNLVPLNRDPSQISEGYINRNIIYEHPAGVVYTKKTGFTQKTFSLDFEKFLPTDAALMEQIDLDTEGCLNPVMIEMNSKWYHGRLQNNRGWTSDYPLTDRYSWQFTESGRVI